VRAAGFIVAGGAEDVWRAAGWRCSVRAAAGRPVPGGAGRVENDVEAGEGCVRGIVREDLPCFVRELSH